MKRTEILTIDLKVKNYDEIKLKQLDTTELIFKILDNSKTVDLNGKTANIIFTRPDKTIIIQECTMNSTEIRVTLSEKCVRVAGLSRIEIEIQENDEIFSSFYINAFIEKTSKENIKADDTKLYIEEFKRNMEEMNKKLEEDVKKRVNELVEEDLSQCREQVIQIASLILAGTEFELPFKYKVGNKSLCVHWENVLLEEGEEGNYMEIGEPGQTSNKIKFGWDIEPGETLIIEVRGVVDE